jgi:hypothetical protein
VTRTALLNGLELTILRLVDGDILLEEEGAALLAEVESARRSSDAEAPAAIRRLAERLEPYTEWLAGGESPHTAPGSDHPKATGPTTGDRPA